MPPKTNAEWREWRKNLVASNPNLNKAGRAFGKGTTSKARRARRGQSSEDSPEPQYQAQGEEWDWDGGWGGSWHHTWSQPWNGDDNWDWRGWTGWREWSEEREGVRLQSASRSPSPCERGRKRSSSRPRRGRRSSRSSSASPDWDRDSATGVPTAARLATVEESPDTSPFSSPLVKGKKARQRSQSVASNASQASFEWRKKPVPTEQEKKTETNGWMKMKRNHTT